ncbi:hypothetical protein LOY89_006012 [Ophidiomyces ophidiicola]|nr:hypothetical protein LOZ59_006142 [Ophidiomyces ophidiicola]KAI2062568.1 hypothetical protein LOZ40_005825 [Ophidiomyces ophidiicola]KAI2131733.1 hypothetical protein LOZ28_006101 [Ophidiomyces ophidiicola]KAI2232391.1 hypothetical protein LOZ14_005223 [Ophidiomyces ophidiicola]KAI2366251.1 hypothetical protein LOY89_006012 [Ophidiomyces ophidiicola]
MNLSVHCVPSKAFVDAIVTKSLSLWLLFCSLINTADILSAGGAEDVIPDSYIAVMGYDFPTVALYRHYIQLPNADFFDFGGLKGFGGMFDQSTIISISNDPTLFMQGAPDATNYIYDESAGEDITLVDTRVDVNNLQFSGRAIWGANFVDAVNTDNNSHGILLASLTASIKYGVVKKAKIASVKILDAKGIGTVSKLVSGIDWCLQNATDRHVVKQTVVHLWLSGSFSRAANDVAEKAVQSGIFASAAVDGLNMRAIPHLFY